MPKLHPNPHTNVPEYLHFLNKHHTFDLKAVVLIKTKKFQRQNEWCYCFSGDICYTHTGKNTVNLVMTQLKRIITYLYTALTQTLIRT